jgi:hypothetical protein
MRRSKPDAIAVYRMVMSFKRIGSRGFGVRSVRTNVAEGADVAVPFGPISVTVAR